MSVQTPVPPSGFPQSTKNASTDFPVQEESKTPDLASKIIKTSHSRKRSQGSMRRRNLNIEINNHLPKQSPKSRFGFLTQSSNHLQRTQPMTKKMSQLAFSPLAPQPISFHKGFYDKKPRQPRQKQLNLDINQESFFNLRESSKRSQDKTPEPWPPGSKEQTITPRQQQAFPELIQ